MESVPIKNLLVMKEAYQKVWLSSTYSNMKMLQEVLLANDLNVAELLRRTLRDTPGRKLHQLGMNKIPDNIDTMISTYKSTGGVCTAFTLKVIFESGRSFEDFTIGTNRFHRLAWDENNILICSARKKIIVVEPSALGDGGFTDPTLSQSTLFKPVENWYIAMKICYRQLLEKDSFLIYFRSMTEAGMGFSGMIKWELKTRTCFFLEIGSSPKNGIGMKSVYSGQGKAQDGVELKNYNKKFLETVLNHGIPRIEQVDRENMEMHQQLLVNAPIIWGLPVLEVIDSED